jgi:hypothetical protein
LLATGHPLRTRGGVRQSHALISVRRRALELKLLDGLMGKTPDNTMASTLFGELKKNKRNGELIRYVVLFFVPSR